MAEQVDRRQFLTRNLPLLALTPFFLTNGGSFNFDSGRCLSQEDPVTDPPTVFDALMQPLREEALRRRQEKSSLAVDQDINQNRTNIVIYGFGDTYEPIREGSDQWARSLIGSYSIYSYDHDQKQLDKISLNHDILAPEISRFLWDRDQHDYGPVKIFRAMHDDLGFGLGRLVLENATGLSADFIVKIRDEAVARYIDQVLNGIDVEVPRDLSVASFYLNDTLHPPMIFRQGRQRFDGTLAVGYIKSIYFWDKDPVSGKEVYDKAMEHHARENLVFDGMKGSTKDHLQGDLLFTPKVLRYLHSERTLQSIDSDLDLEDYVKTNFLRVLGEFGQSVTQNGFDAFTMPEFARKIYIVDPSSGDGGVQWIDANRWTNPKMDQAIKKWQTEGKFNPAMSVPYADWVDPFAEDLINGYWLPVRLRVKQLLTLS